MTQSSPVRITCPKCHEPGEAEIWTSINTRDNPDEAQWLIDGFLFQYECPNCGNVAVLSHDCLYHDPDGKALVQLASSEEKAKQALDALQPYREEGYVARIVNTRYALREKAAILRDGLDDRAVELLKFLTFNKFVADGDIDAHYAAYYGALGDDGAIIVEFVADDGRDPQETEVTRDLYDNALQQVESLATDDPQPVRVDRSWAARTYEQLSK